MKTWSLNIIYFINLDGTKDFFLQSTKKGIRNTGDLWSERVKIKDQEEKIYYLKPPAIFWLVYTRGHRMFSVRFILQQPVQQVFRRMGPFLAQLPAWTQPVAHSSCSDWFGCGGRTEQISGTVGSWEKGCSLFPWDMEVWVCMIIRLAAIRQSLFEKGTNSEEMELKVRN